MHNIYFFLTVAKEHWWINIKEKFFNLQLFLLSEIFTRNPVSYWSKCALSVITAALHQQRSGFSTDFAWSFNLDKMKSAQKVMPALVTICILTWVERRMRNPVKWLMTLATGILYCMSPVASRNTHLEPQKLRHVSSRAWKKKWKVEENLAWVADELRKQVMYFEDVLNNKNFLRDALESNTFLPHHLKHELVTLSISSAQQSTVKGHCHSVSWHEYRAWFDGFQ